MMGKKSSKKSAKNVFFLHTNTVIKNRGYKTLETIFPESYYKCEQKMFGKNRRKKVRKTFFYIHTNIVTKKWGEKTRETNFAEKKE